MSDPVFVAPYSSNRECYHTDRDCRWVDGTYAELPESRAKKTLRACSFCTNDRSYDHEPNFEYYKFARANE